MTTLTPEVGHVYAPRGKEGDTSTWERVGAVLDNYVQTESFGALGVYTEGAWHTKDWVLITPAPVPPADAVLVECAVMAKVFIDGTRAD